MSNAAIPLADQADVVECVFLEQRNFLELLETNGRGSGNRRVPIMPEEAALRRRKVEELAAAATTLRELAGRTSS